METTHMSSKGQVIIPKAIRATHHWKPGTRFVVEEVQGGVLLKPIEIFPESDLKSGLGCVDYRGPAKSPEEMHKAVDAEVARTWRKDKS